MTKVVAASIKETAFTCPHCHALTSQTWHNLHADSLENGKVPSIYSPDFVETVRHDKSMDFETHASLLAWIERAAAGEVLIEEQAVSGYRQAVTNVTLSQCFNCRKVAVWVYDRLLHPKRDISLLPNPDLPAEIARDFEEAARIVNESPRGAAALLRLCVQKLCIHLGQAGKSIDADIAALVKAGLNPIVQKSLDIVRVIGNEAVHPGTIDLNDDRDTALRLFEILNAIADALITHPKSIEVMYSKLPEEKRKGIEKRDKV